MAVNYFVNYIGQKQKKKKVMMREEQLRNWPFEPAIEDSFLAEGGQQILGLCQKYVYIIW